MATLDSVDTPKTDKATTEDAKKKRNRVFKHGIHVCKQYRRKLIKDWEMNIAYRRGKPFATQDDEDRVVVNLDWSYTKQKQASLFSQVPAVRLNHPPQTQAQEMAPWLYSYEQRINDQLIQAGIETAMDEVLPDCINAAGIGIVVVAHEAMTEDVEVPAIDIASMPEFIQQHIMQTGTLYDGNPIPMETVPNILDKRYVVARVSPADFIWPLSFNGSDFDNAPWVGRSGRVTWTEAQRRWKLDEANKNKHVGGPVSPQDSLTYDSERDTAQENEDYVQFDEIFYKTYLYDENARSYHQIHHLVFVDGDEKPVVDEPWKGQDFDQQGTLIGSYKYPIRVLTLSYITDEAIPPSDSAVGRPQVNEIIKSRTQMILQRQHSLPIRGVDVNRIDPTVLYNMMQGKWQAFIPVQGNAQNVIAEISKSHFPQENFTFDVIAKQDLDQLWNTGQPNTGEEVETKGEAQTIAANAATRLGRERAKVGKFFTSIAEVLGGLISIYEDPASIGEGFNPVVSKTLAYSILADSTILLDSQQRAKKIEGFVNMYAKSGYVALEPVLKEAATLAGLDPNVVIRPPEPKPPAEPSISLRLTGTEDLMNPLVLAFLMNAGQAPPPELIEQAKRLIETAVMPPPIDPMTGLPMPIAPPQAELQDTDPNNPANGGPIMPPPMPPAPGPGEDNPNYSAMPKVNQRVLDRQG